MTTIRKAVFVFGSGRNVAKDINGGFVGKIVDCSSGNRFDISNKLYALRGGIFKLLMYRNIACTWLLVILFKMNNVP